MVRLKFTFPPAGGKVAEDYFLVPRKNEFAKQINISKEKNILTDWASSVQTI